MSELMRFGVSMEEKLLGKFDSWVNQHGWANRSEAIRDLVRNQLVQDKWSKAKEKVVATLTFVYDHHVSDLQKTLTRIQHQHEGVVLSSMHMHLDHHNCLEVLVLTGKAQVIQKLSDSILGCRGVKHGQLVRSVCI